MRKLPAVLALYQTDECMDMIAEVLEDRNAFSVTYIPLDSEDILPRSADIDPDILLLEISPAVSVREIRPAVEVGRALRLRTHAQLLLLGPAENRQIVTETSVRTFASGYISPDQSPFLDRIIVETWHRKSPQKILIRELILSSLTDAERRLLEILLGAHDDLRSSPKTIANQKTSIFHKLGLKNLRELRHIFENY